MHRYLRFSIGEIANQGLATTINYSFDAPVEFAGLTTKSNTKGDLEIMKLEDSFNAVISNVTVDVELECTKTLKKFIHHIHIEHEEREYFIDMPPKIDDINNIFLIDKKRLEVDITEFLRQEIILHFPAIPVHYDSSNELLDKYTKPEVVENKPLSALKDLLK